MRADFETDRSVKATDAGINFRFPASKMEAAAPYRAKIATIR